MSLVDPISDMLTRIRNGYAVEKETVSISASKLKEAVLVILKENDYIEDYNNKNGEITISLKYEGEKPAIKNVERISKPGRRIYVKKNEIPTVLSGQGIAVISTPEGIMTGELAKKKKLGGELICKVF